MWDSFVRQESMTPGAMPPRVAVYPPHPLALPSASHRVRVHGTPAFVERHAGVSYARFAMDGPVLVEIEVALPIAEFVVFPAERVGPAEVLGNVLRLELPSPEHVVVWIDGLEKLFLLPDPIEEDAPVLGSPGVFDVTAFGADAAGDVLATASIQGALNAATARPGGGTVVVPPGAFRTGTLTLGSNVRLHVAAGALLIGSRDPADYPVDAGRVESGSDAGLAPDVRYLGRTMTFSRLLLVDGAHTVRITGRGTIDGEGTYLRTRRNAVPNLLRVRSSSDVTVGDVLFRNAAAWSLHAIASSNVSFSNVKVLNDRENLNTDGIDVDMCSDVHIDRAFVHTKDDAICVKATRNGDLSADVRRVTVTNSLVSSRDAALKVGTESEAAVFSDIRFESNHVFDSGRATSVVVRDGAAYERVTFRGVDIGPNVDHLVEQVIGVRDPDARLGAIRDLAFEDVSAPTFRRPASNWTWYAQFRPSRPGLDETVNVFEGADPKHGVDGLTLRRIVVNGIPIRDPSAARDVANLTIGPHVRDVRFV